MTSFARMAALALLVLHAATGSAQSQEKKEAPRVKIAVVNYGYLFTNYDGAKAMKRGLDDELKPLKEEAEGIKTTLLALKASLDSVKGNADASAVIQQQMRDGAKSLEDLDAKARALVGKKQETGLVDLWKDVNNAVNQYAAANDYDLVFGYGDPPNLDPHTFANVNRRMTTMDAGTVILAYVRNGGDITQQVLELLQKNYPAKK
jgi:Skp family chaperone for outer membrane proteins